MFPTVNQLIKNQKDIEQQKTHIDRKQIFKIVN
jgi:hypothetical protein